MPSRTPSISASIDGRMTSPISPLMKKWMPISTSRSSAVQPRRSVVLVKITDSPSTWVARLIAALSTAITKSERYCTMLSRPTARKARSTRSACIRSPPRCSGGWPGSRSAASRRRRAAIQISWAAYPVRSSVPGRRPSSTSTGKASVHGNGVQAATVCIQLGSTSSGANWPARKVNRREEGRVQGRDLGQPEGRQRQAPLDEEAQHGREQEGGEERRARRPPSCPDRSAPKTTASTTATGRTPDQADQLEGRRSRRRRGGSGAPGAAAAARRRPVRIRNSNSHMCQLKVRWPTTISDQVVGHELRPGVGAGAARAGHRLPDDDEHQGLDDDREGPDRHRAAVGQVDGQRRGELAPVVAGQGGRGEAAELGPRVRGPDAASQASGAASPTSSAAGAAKTSSITRSIGGSSMVRSTTGNRASRRPAAAGRIGLGHPYGDAGRAAFQHRAAGQRLRSASEIVDALLQLDGDHLVGGEPGRPAPRARRRTATDPGGSRSPGGTAPGRRPCSGW